eukprot:TRINITY_DN46397_c0_g1_i1.p1 TRINITY_DN46397_c0_g1~~TRINITY_DN46397_c0_g1_i1.p1  ORF type:complete len:181 (-),score=18.20 TRINITY_DN46397_c0_g1_i1:158-700(-)
MVVHQGLEGGIRPATFWKWAVEHENKHKIRHRGTLALAGAATQAAGRTRLADPIYDHGLIYPNLHDVALQSRRPPAGDTSQDAGKVPPSPSPYALWRPPGSDAYGDCCESAVTAVTTCLSVDRLSALGPSSRLSASASAPGLSAPRTRGSSMLSLAEPIASAVSSGVSRRSPSVCSRGYV